MPFRRVAAFGSSLAALAAASVAAAFDPAHLASPFRPTIDDPWGGSPLAGIPRMRKPPPTYAIRKRPDAERKTPEWECSEARKPLYMNAGERRRYLAAKAAGVR